MRLNIETTPIGVFAPEIPKEHIRDIKKDLRCLFDKFVASGKKAQVLNYYAIFTSSHDKSDSQKNKSTAGPEKLNSTSPYNQRQERYRRSLMQYLGIQNEISFQNNSFQLHTEHNIVICHQSQEIPGIYVARSTNLSTLDVKERIFIAKNQKSASTFISSNPEVFN